MEKNKVDLKTFEARALGIRRDILDAVYRAQCGHPGGSLSAVEILMALYGYKMRHRPQEPQWPDRDHLIISKGHASPVVYTVLADFGYFPKEELLTYRKINSRLQGHVHVKVPGVEFNTGSLGHGLSVANGIAMGAKMLGKDINAFCLMGDGEIQEGSVWEAAMSASQFQLNNVCAIIDYNKVQENGPVNEIMNLEPLQERWESFGWEVRSVDGHDFKELFAVLDEFDQVKDKPFLIIANTVKGKGVSFMEGNHNWHGKAPKEEDYKKALAQLESKG